MAFCWDWWGFRLPRGDRPRLIFAFMWNGSIETRRRQEESESIMATSLSTSRSLFEDILREGKIKVLRLSRFPYFRYESSVNHHTTRQLHRLSQRRRHNTCVSLLISRNRAAQPPVRLSTCFSSLFAVVAF